MTSCNTLSCDIAIVGGGLAGGLAALALTARRPDLDVRLIEGGTIGGNHIWSFFDSDVAPDDRWLVAPLIARHWDSYDVAFPGHARTLETGYNSMTGETLAAAVAAAMPEGHIIEQRAIAIAPDHLLLDDQKRLDARHVIDARGGGDGAVLSCGWQKFVGLMLTIAGGHGLTRPTVMDACVAQIDGYRFVYCLPFDAETLFVEDTYYSDSNDLDFSTIRARIATYAAARGWDVTATTREESGVLPVVIAGAFDHVWPHSDMVARIGVRAGAFHATTGYSLPDAVRSASALPALVDCADFAARMRGRAAETWRHQRYYRLLDAMLFRAAEPAQRYRILERFYRLSPELIARFYAGQSTWLDRLRLLSGKPPVPVGKAIIALRDFDWI